MSCGFAQRAENNKISVITVRGEGDIRVSPDEARVRIGILRQAATAQLARDQANNTLANDILAAVTKVGVAAKDIQTSRLTLSPVYAPRATNPNQRIPGYQASNLVSVHLLDLSKVGTVVDAGLHAGANEIRGVNSDCVTSCRQASKP